MHLHDLSPAPGSRRKPKRLGCGVGSGTGKTAGKGHKGQKARTGGGVSRGFEGGQMPVQRRVPKRGFNNARHAVNYEVVNLGPLEERFESGAEITALELLSAGLIHGNLDGVKILATGELTKPFNVKASAFSAKAAEKIAAAGGKAEVI